MNLSTDEIRTAIWEITKTMKGPLPNFERAILHSERQELRMELEQRNQKEKEEG